MENFALEYLAIVLSFLVLIGKLTNVAHCFLQNANLR